MIVAPARAGLTPAKNDTGYIVSLAFVRHLSSTGYKSRLTCGFENGSTDRGSSHPTVKVVLPSDRIDRRVDGVVHECCVTKPPCIVNGKHLNMNSQVRRG